VTLRWRLLLVLLLAVTGVLVPLWAWLSYRVSVYGEARLVDVLFERLEFVTFDYPNLEPPASAVRALLETELRREASDLESWSFLRDSSGATWFSDDRQRPPPPSAVLEALGRNETAQYRFEDAIVHVRPTPWGGAVGLAGPRSGVTALTRELERTYLAGAFALAVLMTLAGWALLHVGLRPLERVAQRAEVLSASSLDERLPVPRSGDEVRSLTLSLNRMLARLEVSFSTLRAQELRTRQFAADASHELRTPLAALGGYLEVLALAPEDPRAKAELLCAARREAERANRLVADLLTLARLDAGEALHKEIVNASDFLERFAASVRLSAPDHIIRVFAAPVPIAVDVLRLEQALLNLVRNAVRYAPTDSEIVLRAETQHSSVCFCVEDGGDGFSTEALERGFERFYRATRDGVGAGLGLAIVRGIARAHGGTAGIQNLAGGGARTWLRIPRDAAN
jgi:two-component system, OmpR family, sensor kinase